MHTADWHIGKNLHKVPMKDQFILFFDWLLEVISREAVDVLLVSGDVFDYANPSAEDRRLYYNFLKSLIDTKILVVITGGNHDSAGFLNAPRDILSTLDIKVVGEACASIEDELIPVKNKEGEVELLIAAVPFLKDKDLRNRKSDAKYENRTEAIRAGIRNHYLELVELIMKKHPGLPSIAMGHLYTIGADPSESERDIHMGNEAAVNSEIFSGFDYVALGHIHRPQIIGKNEFVRYSGSPVPLSFSEKKDMKSVVILELTDGVFEAPRIIPVPKTRGLQRISGSLSELEAELKDFSNPYELPAFLEIILKEGAYSSTMIAAFEELKQNYSSDDRFTIVKSKVEFYVGAKDISSLFTSSKSIEDLKPAEVFKRKLESEDISTDEMKKLQSAFLVLLEMVENED